MERGGGWCIYIYWIFKIMQLLKYLIFSFCSSSPPLLLISLDGFWSGYLKRNFTPFLNSLGKIIINIAYFQVYYLLLCSCQWCEVRVHEERISYEDIPKPLQHSHGECVCVGGGGGGVGRAGERQHGLKWPKIHFMCCYY